MKHIPHITTLFLATLLLFLASSSCKDKNKKTFCEQNPGSCQSVLVAKEFFLFQEGSWWVYEEETTHERDSMYVSESMNDSNSYDFDVKIYSQLQDFNYHYSPLYINSTACSSSSPVSQKCIYIKRSKSKPGEYIGEDHCFFVNYKKGDFHYVAGNIFFINNKIIVDEIYPSYQLGSLGFSQTVKIHELSTLIEGIQPTNHYFAKNVGLVRKELLDSNQVWNLVSYHIEP